MASQWYYTKNGEQHGPISSAQLRQLAASGELQRNDHVFKVGMKEWVRAKKVKGLIPPAFATASPPRVFATAGRASELVEPPIQPTKHRASSSVVCGMPSDETTDILTTEVSSQGNDPKSDSTTQRQPRTSTNTFRRHLAKFGKSSKAAALLVAKQTERKTLEVVTLRGQFHSLGKHIYSDGLHAEAFSAQYEIINKFMTKSAHIEARKAEQPRAEGIPEKMNTANHAIQNKLGTKKMKADASFRDLGRMAYEKYGEHAGPDELVRPIIETQTKLMSLADEISELMKVEQGQVFTPRRILIGVGILAVVSVIAGLQQSGTTSKNERRLVADVANSNGTNDFYDTRCRAIKSVECYATNGTLIIVLAVDPASWTPINAGLHLIVRLFDENGQYLTHFTTEEIFTGETRFFTAASRTTLILQKHLVLLTEQGHRLEYPVNVRDLRDTAAVEVGFIDYFKTN